MEEIFATINGDELQRLIRLFSIFTETFYEKDLLDNADLKQLFKVSDKTLYRWRKKEQLLYVKIGGKFFYPKKILYNSLYQRLLNRYPAKDLPKLY